MPWTRSPAPTLGRDARRASRPCARSTSSFSPHRGTRLDPDWRTTPRRGPTSGERRAARRRPARRRRSGCRGRRRGAPPATLREPAPSMSAQPRQRDDAAPRRPSPASSSAARHAWREHHRPRCDEAAPSSPSRSDRPRARRRARSGGRLEAELPRHATRAGCRRSPGPRAPPTSTAGAASCSRARLDQRHPRDRAERGDVAHRLVRVARARRERGPASEPT